MAGNSVLRLANKRIACGLSDKIPPQKSLPTKHNRLVGKGLWPLEEDG